MDAWFAVLSSSVVTLKAEKTGSRLGKAFPNSGDETDSGSPGSHICGALLLLLLESSSAFMPWKFLKDARWWPKARS